MALTYFFYIFFFQFSVGTYAPVTESNTTCLRCPAGYYSLEKSIHCLNCPAGYITNDNGANCEQCKGGEYSPIESSKLCDDCASGTYSEFEKASTKCLTCPSGYFANVQASECSECATGTIAAEGASYCLACAAGRYSSWEKDEMKCVFCPKGFNAGSPNSDNCKKCSPARYAAVEESSVCDSCVNRSWTRNQEGQSSGVPCLRGETFAGDRCVLCKEGKYSLCKG